MNKQNAYEPTHFIPSISAARFSDRNANRRCYNIVSPPLSPPTSSVPVTDSYHVNFPAWLPSEGLRKTPGRERNKLPRPLNSFETPLSTTLHPFERFPGQKTPILPPVMTREANPYSLFHPHWAAQAPLHSESFLRPYSNYYHQPPLRAMGTPVCPPMPIEPRNLLSSYMDSSSNSRSILRPVAGSTHCEGVTLLVSNLDYTITVSEWAKLLYDTFKRHVVVLEVDVNMQPDNTAIAKVRVPTEDDARLLISQCHKKKVGYKRIIVALQKLDSPIDPQLLRMEVTSILREVSSGCLPLFKFIDAYEKRFYKQITVAQLFQMKDTVEIKESAANSGRMICLQSSIGVPAPVVSGQDRPAVLCQPATPYCPTHCSQAQFSLIENKGMLPYVKVQLDVLNRQIHQLLTQHSGEMHLMSFVHCYEHAFGELTSMSTSDGGVPLEHLITCVSEVQVRLDSVGVKKIVLADPNRVISTPTGYSEPSSSDYPPGQGRSGQVLSQQLSQFSREVVDLLKRMPNCQMSFSKFIPSYHHHFGRQCRVADFGFTKLQELFEAIPHVLQILGIGSQRVLYLTHRIHLRRFTSDLCRVLKAQPDKKCTIEDFPNRYSEVMATELHISSYGVCYINDMLLDIPECTVVVQETDDGSIMFIPKKDQTPEEIEKTSQFAYEVFDLLKNCSQCTMPFNKFIPAYHHHFGRQCRVSDYGFSKLIELFEAIPETVIVKESGEERFISLTKIEQHKVLSEHILTLLKNNTSNAIDVKQLGAEYQQMFGHSLHIEEFGATSVEELVEQIPNIAHMTKKGTQDMVEITNRSEVESLAKECLDILLIKTNGVITIPHFLQQFQDCFWKRVDLMELHNLLQPAFMISYEEQPGKVSLHPLLAEARRMMLLLSHRQGKLTVMEFEMIYKRAFGVNLANKPGGYPCVEVLLQIMNFMVSVRGRGARQTILLRQDRIQRLAHQLAYKIGIYTELVKYKDLNMATGGMIPASDQLSLEAERLLAVRDDIFLGETGRKITKVSAYSPPPLPRSSSMFASSGFGLRDVSEHVPRSRSFTSTPTSSQDLLRAESSRYADITRDSLEQARMFERARKALGNFKLDATDSCGLSSKEI